VLREIRLQAFYNAKISFNANGGQETLFKTTRDRGEMAGATIIRGRESFQIPELVVVGCGFLDRRMPPPTRV
jgi:hypothetical protein